VSFKNFAMVFLGVMLNLLIIFIIATPIYSPYFHSYGCWRCRDRWRSYLPPPSKVARFPAKMTPATIMGCVLYRPSGITGFRTPTKAEVAAADSAIAVFMVQAAAIPEMREMRATFAEVRRQAVWVDRWYEGGSVLVNAYLPKSGEEERHGWSNACTDEQWEWSIEFTPGEGLHHFNPVEDQCERTLPQTPSEMRRERQRQAW
jgi:hypothetical protein